MNAADPIAALPLYSPDSRRHYAAFRVERLLTLTALGMGRERYQEDYARRQVEFITALLNLRDSRLTYDLRVISAPDPEMYTRGRITTALLCRMDGLSAAEARGHAAHLLHLLHAQFDECVFAAVEPEPLLRPFPLAHLAAVTRRAGLARLDSLRQLPLPGRLGFVPGGAAAAPAPPPAPVTIFHLYPFLPTAAPVNALFKFLLQERAPVAISCRLRPAALEAEEEAFLEEQIVTCEQAAQAEVSGNPADLAAHRPTLQEQARLYQRHLLRLLLSLRDNAALLSLEAASPAPLPALLLDSLGNLVSEPAGGLQASAGEPPASHLAGGYEIAGRAQTPGAMQAFADLELTLPPHPQAPPGAARLLHLFDSIEAAAVFRMPRAALEPPLGLNVQSWRSQPAPRDLPAEGAEVGLSLHGGARQVVRIGREDRRRHCYIVGQTGTGKTTLLKTMILDDMRRGEGLCLIDPHGDLFQELLGLVPPERVQDVVVLDPTDAARPVGLNMLEVANAAERHFLVQEFVGILARLIEDEFGPHAAGQFTGPIFYQHMRMNMLLAMSNPDDPGTLLEFYTIFQENDYWRRWLPLRVSDPMLARWVAEVLPRTDYTIAGRDQVSMGAYVGSKFENFVFDPMLRMVFGQKRSTIDLQAIMNQGKILLVNLAKGELTDANARFLGMILLAKLQAAAMARVRIPVRERREFYVYVDEFQNLATQNFITLLSEGRKFGINLVLANQFIAQVKDLRITQSVFGNAGTLICFRLGQEDAEIMARKFAPELSSFDLTNLPNWEGYMTTLVNGQARRPFSIHTALHAEQAAAERAAEVRDWSRRAYGRARAAAERDVQRSLQPPELEEPEEPEILPARRRGLGDLFGS